MKRLTMRQREVLQQLSRKDGQSAFQLGVPSRSGNVLEHLLTHDLITVNEGRVYTTIRGRESLRSGKRES